MKAVNAIFAAIETGVGETKNHEGRSQRVRTGERLTGVTEPVQSEFSHRGTKVLGLLGIMSGLWC